MTEGNNGGNKTFANSQILHGGVRGLEVSWVGRVEVRWVFGGCRSHHGDEKIVVGNVAERQVTAGRDLPQGHSESPETEICSCTKAKYSELVIDLVQ